MASYSPITIEMVAAALPPDQFVTPREIAALLPFDLHRTTIRVVLLILVQQGLALVEGDINQKRYRRRIAA